MKRKAFRAFLWLPWSCLMTVTCLSVLGLLGTGAAEQL